MNVYVIHAFDEIYGGLHGMEDWTIEECKDENEAIDIAKDMSCDVIDRYADITDILAERAEDLLSYDIEEGRIISEQQKETAFNNYYEECVVEDMAYEIVKLDASYTINQYNEMLDSGEYDYEDLVEEFGVEEY